MTSVHIYSGSNVSKPIKLVLSCCEAKLYKGEKCKCINGVSPSSYKADIIKKFMDNVKGNKFDKCATDACGKEGLLVRKEYGY